jgi:hypothetical protein
MRNTVCLLLCCVFLLWPLAAQSKQWELTQDELSKMVQGCDTIIEGKLQNKEADNVYKFRVSEVLQGPQKTASVLLALSSEQAGAVNAENVFILFLQKNNEKYQLFPSSQAIVKSDMFVSDRVRKEALKWRLERSAVVVLATVSEIKEEENSDKSLLVTVQCKTSQVCKGSLATNFIVRYQRVPKAVPPMAFLFQDLAYLFFLKAGQEKNYYELINPYEGAYPERRSFVEEIKLLTRVDFALDREAGQERKGSKLFAQMPAQVSRKESAMVKILLQNLSGGELEVCQQQLSFFTTIHMFSIDGKPLARKQGTLQNEPVSEQSHFVKLAAEDYIVIQDMNLGDTYELVPGQYIVYVQVNLPEKYSGKEFNKNGWSGQVTSNKIELQITE